MLQPYPCPHHTEPLCRLASGFRSHLVAGRVWTDTMKVVWRTVGLNFLSFLLTKGKEQTKEKSENYLEWFNVFILGNQNELSFFTFPTLTAKPRTFFFFSVQLPIQQEFSWHFFYVQAKLIFLFLSWLNFVSCFFFFSLNWGQKQEGQRSQFKNLLSFFFFFLTLLYQNLSTG